MNKFKKLILSLTITLLSSAGVEAMGKQLTYSEFGKLVNQYTANQFLTNAKVKQTGNAGLLEVLLNDFDRLPEGAKSLAETLLRSKFKLTSWQLRAKLASLAPTRAPAGRPPVAPTPQQIVPRPEHRPTPAPQPVPELATDLYAWQIFETKNPDEITKIYKKLALKFHPDRYKGPDADKIFSIISDAYGAKNQPDGFDTIIKNSKPIFEKYIKPFLDSLKVPNEENIEKQFTNFSNLNKDSADLLAQIQTLTAKVNDLTNEVDKSKGGLTDVERLENRYAAVVSYSDILFDTLDNVNNEKSNLEQEIAILKSSGATSAQLKPLQDQLDAANREIARSQAQKAKLKKNKITLQAKIDKLQKLLPETGKVTLLQEEYDNLIIAAQKLEHDYSNIKAKVGFDQPAEIKALTDEVQLTEVINKSAKLRNEIRNGKAALKAQLLNLEQQWSTINDKSYQPKKAAQDAQIQNAFANIKNLNKILNNLIITAENRLAELAQSEKQQKIADIINQLQDVKLRYKKFAKQSSRTPLFKNVTIRQFINNPSTLDTVDASNIGQLRNAIIELNKFGQEAASLQAILTKQVSQIKSEIKSLKTIPVLRDELDAAYNEVIEAQLNYRTLPTMLASFNQLFETKIRDLEASVIIVENVENWIKTLPSEGKVKGDLNDEVALANTIDELDVTELEKQKGITSTKLKEYQKYSAEFNNIEARANGSTTATEKLDNIKPVINIIEQVINKAKANIEAIGDQIAAKMHGGGGTPQGEPAAGVSDVDVTSTRVSFKVDGKEYVIEDEPSALNKFIDDVTKLSPETLTNIGEAIVTEVNKIGDETAHRQMLAKLFATIIYAPYDEAEQAGNTTAMNNIKEIVKPIFKAYPEQEHNLFSNNLKRYGLIKANL